MNPKLAKYSDEELEKQLVKAEKSLKFADIMVIIIVVLFVLLIIVKGSIGSPITSFIVCVMLRFVILPQNIGAIKAEINERKNANAIAENQE